MRELSVSEFVRFIYARIISFQIYKLKLKYFRKSKTSPRLYKKFDYTFDGSRNSVETFEQKLRERFFISDLNRKEFYISLMTSLGGFDSIMDDADMVHENKFMSSGSKSFSFGEKMDWHLDFMSGKRLPLTFYTKINPLDSRNRSGIKVLWEVSRFHQAIWLGKAYWISGSEVHAKKFRDMVNDWIDSNPVGYGINWVSSKEVAIRAMNLIIGLMYFICSQSIDEEFFTKLLGSLYDHGAYIYRNLHRNHQSSDRYVSNFVGLLYIGIFFYDTKFGKRWVKFARRELESEIMAQVYKDGTCHGGSAGYQCLAAELFIAAYVLLGLNKFEISSDFKSRLEKMFEFIASATMRDGKIPAIAEFDGTHVFKMRTEKDPNDHRDILAVAATIFGRGNFKAAAGGYSELALMLLGTQGFEKFSSIRENSKTESAIFPDGGFAILKTEKDFCLFKFGGFERGGCDHNDILSFTISGKNQFIVDRGTYYYTRGADLQDKLHSIYSHNTAVVDKTAQRKFSSVRFVRKDQALPELLEWSSTMEQDVIEAQHHAYEHLSQAVAHKRKITFNKRQRTFISEDNFMGEGKHEIELMFQFAPKLKVADLGRNFLALEGKEFALLKFQLPFIIEDWEHSQAHSILTYAKAARLKVSAELPVKIETFIFILSSLDEMNYLLNHIR